jgi:hypothetical protein
LKRHLKQLTPIQRRSVFFRRRQSRYAFANRIERDVSEILCDDSTADSDAKHRYPQSPCNTRIDQHQKKIKSRLPR